MGDPGDQESDGVAPPADVAVEYHCYAVLTGGHVVECRLKLLVFCEVLALSTGQGFCMLSTSHPVRAVDGRSLREPVGLWAWLERPAFSLCGWWPAYQAASFL